ncbi:MAG: hypothetical protein ACFNXV_05425 [Pauljensenia sp.]|uniref:hypothetical protein n=1 Tax=Kytococcus sedentarius TaxID=1276 RepID=UPI000660D4BE|nr:hypothetical protein [Kytococcus sedentarius]
MFYDYWTFNRPTVIKTSESGRLLEATVYDPTINDDEQAITVAGEAACREYVRQAVAWESEDADRIRHDACVRSVLARITELAEDTPALTTWALAHAPAVDIDTENLTLTLTDLDGNPMIDLHTSRIAGGGWARLPGHSFDDLDNIIKSSTLRHLAHMVGAQRKQLASFLRSLSTELDDILNKVQHAPGIPTLTGAIEAARNTPEAAESDVRRPRSMPSDLLGSTPPRITEPMPTVPTTSMRWVRPVATSRSEGRSL